MPEKEREEALTLELLEAIEARSDLTQRHLAERLGVALGLTNSYLRRCVRKGLIKIQQAPANRYLYYLTPKGFAEKSRLAAAYLGHSLQLYRQASNVMASTLVACEAHGWQRVLIAGASELAEIASIGAHDIDVVLIGTFDPGYRREGFIGRPVWRTPAEIPQADACIYCALVRIPEWLEILEPRFGSDRFIIPELVRPLLVAPGDTPARAEDNVRIQVADAHRRLNG